MAQIYVNNTVKTKPSFQNVNLIGIDCEWKPSFGVQRNELALMQIATRTDVFIIDVIKLGTVVSCLWQEVGMILFNNCDILKLGNCFGMFLVDYSKSLSFRFWFNK